MILLSIIKEEFKNLDKYLGCVAVAEYDKSKVFIVAIYYKELHIMNLTIFYCNSSIIKVYYSAEGIEFNLNDQDFIKNFKSIFSSFPARFKLLHNIAYNIT